MNKRPSFIRFPGLCLFIIFLMIACSVKDDTNSPGETSKNIIYLAQGESNGLGWKLLTVKEEYFYTDRIPLTLEIDYSETINPGIDDKSIKKGQIWGDFRLYEYKRINLNTFLLTMEARKTGPSVFSNPEVSPFPFLIQVEIPILSQLNTGKSKTITEPFPLIELKPAFKPIYLLIILLVFIGCTSALLLLLLKRKKRRTLESHSEMTLSDLLLQAPKTENERECLDFYQKVYRLLLKNLSQSHPAVCLSDSPGELVHHLEEPSGLNQWALRSLYPFLEDLESLFYAPGNKTLLINNFSRNLNILSQWLDYTKSEKEEMLK